MHPKYDSADLDEALHMLHGLHDIIVRAAVVKHGDPWLDCLVIDWFPGHEIEGPRECDYGGVVFLADHIEGPELSIWLEQGLGSLRGHKFELRVTQSNLSKTRYPRYGNHEGFIADRPFVVYSLPAANPYQPPPVEGALMAPRSPSFNSYDDAVRALVYAVPPPPHWRNRPGTLITIRAASSQSWIESVEVGDQIGVSVRLSEGDSAFLDVVGGRGEQLMVSRSGEYLLPRPEHIGMESAAVLFMGNDWVDYANLFDAAAENQIVQPNVFAEPRFNLAAKQAATAIEPFVELLGQPAQNQPANGIRRVFLSHSSENTATATALETVLRSAFDGQVDVFNTSNRASIRMGDPWRDEILINLRQCKILLAIVTPNSIAQPWLNFECGGAWLADNRVIPCCAQGMRKSDLRPPLGDLQAADLLNPEDLRGVVERIGDTFEVSPSLDYDFEAACASLVASWSGSNFRVEDDDRRLVIDPKKADGATEASPSVTKVSEGRIFVSRTPEELTSLFLGHTDLQAQGLIVPYIGQWMTVRGPMGEVMLITPQMVTVYFADRSVYTYNVIRMYFNEKKWVDRLASISPGDNITVEGKISAVDRQSVNLDNCKLDT